MDTPASTPTDTPTDTSTPTDTPASTPTDCEPLTHLEIIVRETEFSPVTLNKFSRINKYFNSATQWRLDRANIIRKKHLPRFGQAVRERLIGHPFKYDVHSIKAIPLLSMGMNKYGIAPCDTMILSDDRLTSFSDVSLITRAKIPFDILLIIDTEIIYVMKIDINDYIDLTPALLEEQPTVPYDQLRTGGLDSLSEKGRYLINLKLPTRVNQIPFGDPFINTSQLHICVSHCANVTRNHTDYVFDIDVAVAYISHMMIHYDSMDIPYNVNDYCIAYNGGINSHVYKYSLVRKHSNIVVEYQQDERFEMVNQLQTHLE